MTDWPLVEVHWEDAASVSEWGKLPEAQAFENVDFDYHCRSVGFLIRDDDECVVLASRRTGDGSSVGLVERIPRGMVRKVIVVRRGTVPPLRPVR